MSRPRVFISHCEDHPEPTQFAARIIALLGCSPVIAELEPALARSLPALVRGTMESCDVVMVIATRDASRDGGWIPSSSVTDELTRARTLSKFKGLYFLVVEEGVQITPLHDLVYHRFSQGNFGTIAEAIILELSGMNKFLNYYASPASELNFHELADTLTKLRELRDRGAISDEWLGKIVSEQIVRAVQNVMRRK